MIFLNDDVTIDQKKIWAKPEGFDCDVIIGWNQMPYSSSDSSSEDDGHCFKCGRYGHWANECYAKTSVFPRGGYKKRKAEEENDDGKAGGYKKRRDDEAGIYSIQDSTGKVYVGKSMNVKKRVGEHMQGLGTSFLCSGEITPIKTITSGSKEDLESWERSETLAQMYRKGIKNVRGWMYTSHSLSEQQIHDAFGQVCEKFDLCRKCGRNSHFVDKCFAKTKAEWASR
jgi:predicted GIY-YIG superfamily endonuclease